MRNWYLLSVEQIPSHPHIVGLGGVEAVFEKSSTNFENLESMTLEKQVKMNVFVKELCIL